MSLDGEFRDTVDAYLQNLASSEMRSLADIIQFNRDQPELQAGISMTHYIYPRISLHSLITHNAGQPWFIGPQEFEQTPEEYEKVRKQIHEDAGPNGIYRVMDELSLDFICAPTDGPISEISALAGQSPHLLLV